MIDIPLAPMANQSLSIPLGGNRYEITVKEANGCMVCTIDRDGEVVVRNVALRPNDYVLPYRYGEAGQGNFFFSVEDEQLPDWHMFGRTQYLVYVTADEIEGA